MGVLPAALADARDNRRARRASAGDTADGGMKQDAEGAMPMDGNQAKGGNAPERRPQTNAEIIVRPYGSIPREQSVAARAHHGGVAVVAHLRADVQ